MSNNSTIAAISGFLAGLAGAAVYARFFARPSSKDATSVVTTKASPAGGHYSQAVVANGFVTISGLLPITSDGTKLADKSFAEQTMMVLQNLDAILTASGSSRDQLVNCRVYVSNIEDWGEFNVLYGDWLGRHKPARCVVPVPLLHYGLRLELEAVATV